MPNISNNPNILSIGTLSDDGKHSVKLVDGSKQWVLIPVGSIPATSDVKDTSFAADGTTLKLTRTDNSEETIDLSAFASEFKTISRTDSATTLPTASEITLAGYANLGNRDGLLVKLADGGLIAFSYNGTIWSEVWKNLSVTAVKDTVLTKAKLDTTTLPTKPELVLTTSDGTLEKEIKVDVTEIKKVSTEASIKGDGVTSKIQLEGDSATPGNNKVYGTNATGTKGFIDLPVVTIIDNLTSSDTDKPLSANQGKVLKLLIEGIGERVKVADNTAMGASNAPDGTTFFVVNDNASNKWALYQKIANTYERVLGQSDLATAIIGLTQAQVIDSNSTILGLISGELIAKAVEAKILPSTQTEVDNGTKVANKYIQPDTLKLTLDKKVSILDIVDNLTSTDTNKPLSANQGKVLKALIDGIGERVKVADNAAMGASTAPDGTTFFVVNNNATNKWAIYQRIAGTNEQILSQTDLASSIIGLTQTQAISKTDTSLGLGSGELLYKAIDTHVLQELKVLFGFDASNDNLGTLTTDTTAFTNTETLKSFVNKVYTFVTSNDVVQKATTESPVIDKINVYTFGATIGTAPTVVANKAYSTAQLRADGTIDFKCYIENAGTWHQTTLVQAAPITAASQSDVDSGTAVTDKYVQPDTLKVALDKKSNITDIVDNVTSTDVNKPLSANQGKKLEDAKISKTNIVDNLTTADATKVLSATQGKVLQDTKEAKIVSTGFKAVGSENTLGLNTTHDTAQKIFDKLNSYIALSGKKLTALSLVQAGNVLTAQAKIASATIDDLLIEWDTNGTPSYEVVAFAKFADKNAFKSVAYKNTSGTDQYVVEFEDYNGTKSSLDLNKFVNLVPRTSIRDIATATDTEIVSEKAIRAAFDGLSGIIIGEGNVYSSLPTTKGSYQVRPGDYVIQRLPETGTGTVANPQYPAGIYKWDSTKWVNSLSLGTNVAPTGDFIGVADIYSALPTSSSTKPAVQINDWSYQRLDTIGTGTTLSPQYPAGFYAWDGTKYNFLFAGAGGTKPVDEIVRYTVAPATFTAADIIGTHVVVTTDGTSNGIIRETFLSDGVRLIKIDSSFPIAFASNNQVVPATLDSPTTQEIVSWANAQTPQVRNNYIRYNRTNLAAAPTTDLYFIDNNGNCEIVQSVRSSASGVFMGSANVFANLPIITAEGHAVASGDTANVEIGDATNPRGVYRFDGTNYQLSARFDLATVFAARNDVNANDPTQPTIAEIQAWANAQIPVVRSRHIEYNQAATRNFQEATHVWHIDIDGNVNLINSPFPDIPVVDGLLAYSTALNVGTALSQPHPAGGIFSEYIQDREEQAILLTFGTTTTAGDLKTELGTGTRVLRRKAGLQDAIITDASAIGQGTYLIWRTSTDIIVRAIDSSDGMANSPVVYTTGTPANPTMTDRIAFAINSATNFVTHWWNPALGTPAWVQLAIPRSRSLAWAANTPLEANEPRWTVISGATVFLHNRAARNSGASLSAAEYDQFDYIGQSFTPVWSANTVYPRGFRVEGTDWLEYQRINAGTSTGQFNDAERGDWRMVSSQMIIYHTGTPVDPQNLISPALAVNTATNQITHRWNTQTQTWNNLIGAATPELIYHTGTLVLPQTTTAPALAINTTTNAITHRWTVGGTTAAGWIAMATASGAVADTSALLLGTFDATGDYTARAFIPDRIGARITSIVFNFRDRRLGSFSGRLVNNVQITPANFVNGGDSWVPNFSNSRASAQRDIVAGGNTYTMLIQCLPVPGGTMLVFQDSHAGQWNSFGRYENVTVNWSAT